MKIRVEYDLTEKQLVAGIARAIVSGYWSQRYLDRYASTSARRRSALRILRMYLQDNGSPDTDLSDVDDDSIRDAEYAVQALLSGQNEG